VTRMNLALVTPSDGAELMQWFTIHDGRQLGLPKTVHRQTYPYRAKCTAGVQSMPLPQAPAVHTAAG